MFPAGIPLISIVDDDDAHRKSLENLIRSVGLWAKGFSSAEAFLGSNHMHETSCLVLDVRMPGMSGPDLQRRMAVANSPLPIIFITGARR
jgi:FixJ family two-component response regulator